MLDKSLTDSILSLIKREVVPATGCTEPIAVALAVARATEVLGELPAHISASLSANILKNAMGVGIPGTGMIGLPIAIAVAAVSGRSERQLEVLNDVDERAVARGRQLIDEGRIDIGLADTDEKLYILITATDSRGRKAVTEIAGSHTRFTRIELDGKPVDSAACHHGDGDGDDTQADPRLTLSMLWELATTTDLDRLQFIMRTRDLNLAAAREAMERPYGHSVGTTLLRTHRYNLLGDSPFTHILAYTSAACDARMGGACVPVMSNSGSGNQGIAATLPVVMYARETGIADDDERLVRALVLSHLTVIYIKQSLGRLSALCGCVVAATGSACGITYLMGGDFAQVAASVKNMIGNLTGMICDGAKPGCALKLATGVSTAIISAMMAMEGHCVDSVEGIIDDDVDRCVANFALIGHDAMAETDRQILNIMVSKQSHDNPSTTSNQSTTKQ